MTREWVKKAEEDNLDRAYREMAEDETREAHALEWAEGTVFSE
jgi:hypothetical protein